MNRSCLGNINSDIDSQLVVEILFLGSINLIKETKKKKEIRIRNAGTVTANGKRKVFNEIQTEEKNV